LPNVHLRIQTTASDHNANSEKQTLHCFSYLFWNDTN
jgi:hypothetical protein